MPLKEGRAVSHGLQVNSEAGWGRTVAMSGQKRQLPQEIRSACEAVLSCRTGLVLLYRIKGLFFVVTNSRRSFRPEKV
jgi:hypothetical protein